MPAAAAHPARRGRPALPGPLVAALGLAALALALGGSIVLGATPVSPEEALTAFTDYDGSREHVVVAEVRAPRALLAAVVGAALGVAGAVMQAITRNPLAEPGILGISWGAALVAVGAQVLLGVGSLAALASFALVGAAGAGLLVVVLGSLGREGLTPAKLVVAGATISALLSALLQGLLVLDAQSLQASRRWLGGSLVGRDADVLLQALPYLVAGLVVALALARPLTALSLGEDIARGLGQRTGVVKAGAAAAVILLAGGAVAVAGPLMLVGLAVPHLARFLVGRDYRRVLPATALFGALLVVSADVAARLVIPPEELPVGVMTAIVGAPAFLHVARRGVVPL